MSVEVIIVNYNGGGVIERCLAALQKQTRAHSVQVIDNASTDGSARAIHSAFPDVAILPLRRNTGFARAVNIGVQRSSADIVITLNPDTLPDPRFIEYIVAPFADDPQLASVAGTMLFESRPDIIASAGIDVHRNGVAIDSQLGEDRQTATVNQRVFGASGGAAAFRRSAFVEVGGFAEPFFMYLEDVDLAWRLRLAGYGALWCPNATVLHRYSSSAGEGSSFKRRLLARNRIWTLVRCLPSELWKRDGARIFAFDAAATGFGVATLDGATVAGRMAAIAGILPRLVERDRIQRSMSADIDELSEWVQPAISPQRLRRLRSLTAALAGE